jgi:hypothetical protein
MELKYIITNIENEKISISKEYQNQTFENDSLKNKIEELNKKIIQNENEKVYLNSNLNTSSENFSMIIEQNKILEKENSNLKNNLEITKIESN